MPSPVTEKHVKDQQADGLAPSTRPLLPKRPLQTMPFAASSASYTLKPARASELTVASLASAADSRVSPVVVNSLALPQPFVDPLVT
ncbi:hypothetical protein BD289DRAFT_447801 [Coniella lustricola]|uniref:Uncharacterized protein n=1 Tax=Coniella lustricola TaxID=2025994 RepID=A0A2T2ZSR5_9PEZI|nr:hypothetical protein BD289DRAFT_447801 [Coniella lustricola]